MLKTVGIPAATRHLLSQSPAYGRYYWPKNDELHSLEARGLADASRALGDQVRCVYYWLKDGGVVVCGMPATFLWSGKSFCEEHIDAVICGHTYGARVRQGRR